jgi:hypothetical protein
VIDDSQALLTQLGFRFGLNGPHAARTMMLDDIKILLAHLPADATREDYETAVIGENLLAKPTRKARELAFRHLATLYALDNANPIFRAMRRLWALNISAQPLLALAVALARDPLLRATQSFVLQRSVGTSMSREQMETLLSETYPDRFSDASIKSFAQNIGGTWTSAGLLQGRARKIRAAALATAESTVLFLFLGYLEGRTGERLLTSPWMDLAGIARGNLEALVNAASHRGLLVYMSAGGVTEVRFPGYLTAAEELIRQEVAHVI